MTWVPGVPDVDRCANCGRPYFDHVPNGKDRDRRCPSESRPTRNPRGGRRRPPPASPPLPRVETPPEDRTRETGS